MQLCKYSAAAVSFWENSQPQQFFCISFDFISFCSEDVNWDCCGLFWTLETGMRQSLFLYTIHSCWMRIIQLCFKLYLKSIGDRSLGFLFSFFFPSPCWEQVTPFIFQCSSHLYNVSDLRYLWIFFVFLLWNIHFVNCFFPPSPLSNLYYRVSLPALYMADCFCDVFQQVCCFCFPGICFAI